MFRRAAWALPFLGAGVLLYLVLMETNLPNAVALLPLPLALLLTRVAQDKWVPRPPAHGWSDVDLRRFALESALQSWLEIATILFAVMLSVGARLFRWEIVLLVLGTSLICAAIGYVTTRISLAQHRERARRNAPPDISAFD